jgi:cysteine desulfurase
MKMPIYLDSHATTPVDPRALEAMSPFLGEAFGNASSRTHAFGWRAEEAVTRARVQVGRAIGADPKAILFTSGATESNNLALMGVFEAQGGRGDHIISAATEHPAVLDVLRHLEGRGARVTLLGVDRSGRVDPEDLRRAITESTILVSLMFANNEVGTIHPMREIGAICKDRGVLFHTDAAQAVGKIPVDVEAMGIDLLSMSAHKVYGPKGCGALYVRRRRPRVRLSPILHGGGQERGLRPGTLNVPGIVGLGKALEIAVAEMAEESRRVGSLRDHCSGRSWRGSMR